MWHVGRRTSWGIRDTLGHLAVLEVDASRSAQRRRHPAAHRLREQCEGIGRRREPVLLDLLGLQRDRGKLSGREAAAVEQEPESPGRFGRGRRKSTQANSPRSMTTPHSSSVSRRHASHGDSPASTWPPGIDQRFLYDVFTIRRDPALSKISAPAEAGVRGTSTNAPALRSSLMGRSCRAVAAGHCVARPTSDESLATKAIANLGTVAPPRQVRARRDFQFFAEGAVSILLLLGELAAPKRKPRSGRFRCLRAPNLRGSSTDAVGSSAAGTAQMQQRRRDCCRSNKGEPFRTLRGRKGGAARPESRGPLPVLSWRSGSCAPCRAWCAPDRPGCP